MNLPLLIPHVSDHYFQKIRDEFDIFTRHPDIIYMDSASSTHIPENVMMALHHFRTDHYANPGRGVYDWAIKTHDAVLKVRSQVAHFIGANSLNDIVYTTGTTMSLNMVAKCWAQHNLKDGDEVLYCPLDHSSMVLPIIALQNDLAARGINIILKPYNLKTDGEIDYNHLLAQVTDKTRLVNVTHIHNVAGTLNDVQYLRSQLPDHVLINLDAAQSIAHVPINVQYMGVHFLSFSGHKMFSENGIGVLWVHPCLQDGFKPFLYGGGMALSNNSDPFYKHIEAGTQNLSGIISLGAAIDFINSMGRMRIEHHMSLLTKSLYQIMIRNPRVDMIFPIKEYNINKKQGLIAFKIENFSSAEVGDLLADQGIYVRYGQHCSAAEVLNFNNNALEDSVRVSLSIYNSLDDIARLSKILQMME